MNSARFLDKGHLYVVALPIGNPEDITLRAQNILNSVDIVAVEDTRTFKQWAERWNVAPKRLIAFHEHNESASTEGIVHLLVSGQSVALTSDAGTPGVSDPGFRLMKTLFDLGIKPIPVPGPSSLTAALSICPIGGTTHFFGAFPPAERSARRTAFQNAKYSAHRLIFFESPHRVLEHLDDALEIFGNTSLAIFRELTKEHQEILHLNVDGAITHFQTHPPRGEFVLIYEGLRRTAMTQTETEAQIRALLREGKSAREIRESLLNETDLSRRDLFDLIERCKKE